jgi:hypothetical protein
MPIRDVGHFVYLCQSPVCQVFFLTQINQMEDQKENEQDR